MARSALTPTPVCPVYTLDDLDDLDDAPDAEVEETEEVVVDQATAARTIAELQAEIGMLKKLEDLAYKVRHSGTDKKWDELVDASAEQRRDVRRRTGIAASWSSSPSIATR